MALVSKEQGLTVVASVTPVVLATKAVAATATALATAKRGCTGAHALKPPWNLLVCLLYQATAALLLTKHKGHLKVPRCDEQSCLLLIPIKSYKGKVFRENHGMGSLHSVQYSPVIYLDIHRRQNVLHHEGDQRLRKISDISTIAQLSQGGTNAAFTLSAAAHQADCATMSMLSAAPHQPD